MKPERFAQDFLYGIRIFARAPGFTLIAILTLALGIGANTAIFSIVNAVLLRTLPYHDSNRLIAVWGSGLHEKTKLFDSYRDFEIYSSRRRTLAEVAGTTWATGAHVMTGWGPAQNVLAMPATVNFFTMLGVSPMLGRAFRQEDLKQGCTVVLAHRFWQRDLGERPDIVGQSLQLDDESCLVVGVMPGTFAFYPDAAAMWSLITPNGAFARDPDHSNIGIFARLKPGASIESAQAELTLLHRQAHQHDRHGLETKPLAYPLQEEFTWLTSRTLRLSLIVLFASVSFVLLIACVNVANLLLGRSFLRQRELAIRSALGSGRARLLRQLLTEALLLSISAAMLGALFAAGAIQWFRAYHPIDMPPGNRVEVNLQVLAFTAALSILTTILFGFVPAWKASQADLNEVLKSGGRSATGSRARHVLGKCLVVAEVTLSMVLLVGAGLLIQSVVRFASVPLGFSPDRMVSMTLSLPPTEYSTISQRLGFMNRLSQALHTFPELETFSFCTQLPTRGVQGFDVLEVQTHPPPSLQTAKHDIGHDQVSAEYFGEIGVPLQKGRLFDSRDQEKAEPVAIINQALAATYFPNEDPLGKHIRSFGAPAKDNPWLTIVGIVANEKRGALFQEMGWAETPTIYRPITQNVTGQLTLLVRSRLDSARVATIVQKQVSLLDSGVPIDNTETLEQVLQKEHLAYPRFRATLLGCFAGLALLLAAIGLYGVLAQMVAQRTQEIGIRIALGAQSSEILTLILREGMLLVGIGIALGLSIAALITRFLAALLYGVRATDPITLITVSLVLIATALLAICLPARRAAAVEPVIALKYE